jgi:hypothetical protein
MRLTDPFSSLVPLSGGICAELLPGALPNRNTLPGGLSTDPQTRRLKMTTTMRKKVIRRKRKKRTTTI